MRNIFDRKQKWTILCSQSGTKSLSVYKIKWKFFFSSRMRTGEKKRQSNTKKRFQCWIKRANGIFKHNFTRWMGKFPFNNWFAQRNSVKFSTAPEFWLSLKPDANFSRQFADYTNSLRDRWKKKKCGIESVSLCLPKSTENK